LGNASVDGAGDPAGARLGTIGLDVHAAVSNPNAAAKQVERQGEQLSDSATVMVATNRQIDSATTTGQAEGDRQRDRSRGEPGGRAIEELFDENDREIPGSNPPQLLARFTDCCDRHLPPVLEKYPEVLPHIEFATPNDRNGYVPTHNRKFPQPRGPDPGWNAANAHNRMVFPAHGIQRKTFVEERKSAWLSTLRRDLGGGRHVMMKNASGGDLGE
jgi:hypothetical protein